MGTGCGQRPSVAGGGMQGQLWSRKGGGRKRKRLVGERMLWLGTGGGGGGAAASIACTTPPWFHG